MKTLAARNAKNSFGRLIDTAIAEPVLIEKHGRPIVVVISVEEYAKLKSVIPKGPSRAAQMLKAKKSNTKKKIRESKQAGNL